MNAHTPVRYQLQPVPFTAVTLEDDFWRPRLETNRTVTIPYDFQKCEETGRIANFAKAAGLLEGDHEGIYYNDSDVFKIVEGAAYSLSLHPDPALDRYLDDLIQLFAAAQEPDGYLYTVRTIAERTGRLDRLRPDREGLTRWSNLRVNHELYNVGHLYEAAVAHFRATGKRTLLDVALKNADLIDRVFGPDKRRDVPGHQEIEIGLVKLYQVTGDPRYLRLAQFFLDERGHAHGRELYMLHDDPGYMQDHLPVTQQRTAVGHAVRAGYMYCGMADVATLTDNQAYIQALDAIWENVVNRKLYLTGGIGARHKGEAFGEDYELPNDTAYAETCAAIANIFWNQRMFLLHGDARYVDVLERTLYNGFLAGVSLGGDHFFYVNPLAFDGSFPFNRHSIGRQPWFDCSCCPSNVVRFLPSLPGYVYAQAEDRLYVNLFVAGRATVALPGAGGDVQVMVEQETRYPWDGQIRLRVRPERPAPFALHIRIPGWARNRPVPGDLYRYLDRPEGQVELAVNGQPQALTMEKGFAVLRRTWQPGDVVALHLPMAVRRVASHPQVVHNRGRVALERGPLVYCVEAVDHGGRVHDLVLPDGVSLQPQRRPDLLGGITVLAGQLGDRTLTAIPYYAWAHRELGEMAVWLPRNE
ncbi:glycoside hydrolase family 127 protein [Litorilinea aerophila]|uniref:Glycoside hydrolase family 127 protein n=1 Tax=Litorilinea aerophila TaxID=1204385 RepID=A0A540VJ04_9CHLR|nr:glycoside hydrolase family 127 protein [Litorilinea aerophila]MCC9075597.1 glycoside hydrolase family 127 protein [Litorilinea aerophila]